MPGVEPGSQACEACMIPLHYMRDVFKRCNRPTRITRFDKYTAPVNAHAGCRTRVTGMGALYDTATEHAPHSRTVARTMYARVDACKITIVISRTGTRPPFRIMELPYQFGRGQSIADLHGLSGHRSYLVIASYFAGRWRNGGMAMVHSPQHRSGYLLHVAVMTRATEAYIEQRCEPVVSV